MIILSMCLFGIGMCALAYIENNWTDLSIIEVYEVGGVDGSIYMYSVETDEFMGVV